MEHDPVLLKEVLNALDESPLRREGGALVDATLGLGGYSEAILARFPQITVFGIDRDLAALEFAQERLASFSERFYPLHVNFGDMETKLSPYGLFNAFVFDLGVSNMQLVEAGRGFSFQRDGPLDMRMDPHGGSETAASILNGKSAAELADIFWRYGEERWSRVIASRIESERRRGHRLQTTGELVALIRDVLPAPVQRRMGGHPARRIFQALRIFVNDELGELESALSVLPTLAAGGCVAAVVSYHSLEDRIVKHTFRRWEKEEKKGRVRTRRPILPTDEETERNYKARSAKLRVFDFS